jgi:hypothetical protein
MHTFNITISAEDYWTLREKYADTEAVREFLQSVIDREIQRLKDQKER